MESFCIFAVAQHIYWYYNIPQGQNGPAKMALSVLYTFILEGSVVQIKMGGAFMILSNEIRQQLIELRQLEEAARVQFDLAKNQLLKIKKRIQEMEKLLNPLEN